MYASEPDTGHWLISFACGDSALQQLSNLGVHPAAGAPRITIQTRTRPISFPAEPWSDRQFDHFLVPTHKLGESLVNVSAGDADVRRDELSKGDVLLILLATAH